MFKKVSRYLCFTRAYPHNGLNNVLAGVQILTEKDFPPTGYSMIDRTIDTSEKACRKKAISIKMTNRDTTTDAVTDIILLTKSKRPPEGYSIAGDVNGVIICVKVGKVPVETQQFQHATPNAAVNQPPTNYMQRPAPPPPLAGYTNNANHVAPSPYMTPPVPAPRTDIPNRPATGTIKRADSTLAQNPLADVSFQLNSKYQNNKAAMNFQIPDVQYRSLIDVENEYNYSFTLEKSAVQRLPSTGQTM